MTFHDISLKMMKSNYRKYVLYYNCIAFSIALFYVFATIFTNDIFMNYNYVDSIISSNIIAPSVFMGVFIVIFIPYAYGVFNRYRRSEYAVLMTIGMNEKEVICNILYENVIVGVIALISGLILGNILAFIFYGVIYNVIGIKELKFTFNIKAYKITAGLYIIATVIGMIISFIDFYRIQIVDMIKNPYSDYKVINNFSVLITGIAFLIASIVLLKICKKGTLAIVLGIGSLWIIISGSYKLICSIIKDKIGQAILRVHYNSYRLITFITAIVFGFMLYFTSLSLILYPIGIENASRYSPYELAFSRIFDKNNIDDEDIKNIMEANDIDITAKKEIRFVRNNAINIMSVNEVNSVFDCDYSISEGHFIELYQYYDNDGYIHEINTPHKLALDDSGWMLESSGYDIRVLFNKTSYLADRTFIVNDADYRRLEEKEEYWKGYIELYHLSQWKKSKGAIDELQKKLDQINEVETADRQSKISSRIYSYNKSVQSSEFLVFIMLFLMILFYVSMNIVIDFKIQSEIPDERKIYRSLYRMGISNMEMKKIIAYKNIAYFMYPGIIGVIITMFYGNIYNFSFGLGGISFIYTFIVSIMFLVLQYIFTCIYSNIEMKRIVN